ncbi:hypothetical protein [Natronorubrum sp. FCH18a]|uniref:hypothetical protein n=1 Tax=Natronorubrum sp. FCH18a TaxID=3447018 RepID=UPI003F510BBA
MVGALIVATSSGAFDVANADRGVGVETASDESALLGFEYPSEDRTLELNSDDADGGGGCFLGFCSPYRYNDVVIVVFEDNTPSNELSIGENDLTVDVDNDDIVGGEELRHEPTDDGLRVVLGDFRCSSAGAFGSGDQQHRSATVTIDAEVSGEKISIDLERTVDLECVAD